MPGSSVGLHLALKLLALHPILYNRKNASRSECVTLTALFSGLVSHAKSVEKRVYSFHQGLDVSTILHVPMVIVSHLS